MRAGPITLRYVSGAPVHPARVAYAVGRRAGSAVERNRIRRRLRAVVTACATEFTEGGAYLFEADRAVLTTAFADLCTAVSTAVHDASGGSR